MKGNGLAGKLAPWIAPLASGKPWVAPSFYAVVVLGLMGSLLFVPGDRAIAKFGLDLTTFICPVYAFAADQLRHGHIPLWNPYTFCGTPFVANFQSAVFYPFTWLHLILPMAKAINWTATADLFLSAWFTYLCARRRGIGQGGSLLAGLAFCFSGAVYFRLYSGMLAIINTMTWAPLLLLCIDHILDDAKLSWTILGGVALALMILAGSVPLVYCTAITFAVYTLAALVTAKRRWRALYLLPLLGLIAIGLSAIQLFPGLSTSREFIRADGMHYDFAKVCPIPPENLLTMIAPSFWNDPEHGQYIGRWNFWESTLYTGAAATALAAIGIACAKRRGKWPIVIAAAVTLILAMGVHVHIGSFNLFGFLFNRFPYYNHFRGVGRFGMPLAILFALLAGMGVDVLATGGKRALRSGIVAIAVALLLAITGIWLHHDARQASGAWAQICHAIVNSKQASTQASFYAQADNIITCGHRAAAQLGLAAAFIAAIGVLALLAQRRRWCATLAATVAAAELIYVAALFRVSGSTALPMPDAWASAQAQLAPDERVLHTTFAYANLGMADGIGDLYGYDPLALKRYAQLLAATQRINPDTVDYPPPLSQKFRLMQLMRCRYVLFGSGVQGGASRIGSIAPHLVLIDNYHLQPEHIDNILEVINPAFNAASLVVLETKPDPEPVLGHDLPGTASVVSESPGNLEIAADITRPLILVIGDAYSKDWHARAVEPGAQKTYTIQPADYAFQAVPLAAGKHHFLLEYKPVAFIIGKWTTLLTLLLVAAASAWLLTRRRSQAAETVNNANTFQR